MDTCLQLACRPNTDTAHQNEAYSCGIYLCATILTMEKSRTPKNYPTDEEDLNRMRLNILTRILPPLPKHYISDPPRDHNDYAQQWLQDPPVRNCPTKQGIETDEVDEIDDSSETPSANAPLPLPWQTLDGFRSSRVRTPSLRQPPKRTYSRFDPWIYLSDSDAFERQPNRKKRKLQGGESKTKSRRRAAGKVVRRQRGGGAPLHKCTIRAAQRSAWNRKSATATSLDT